MQAIGCCRDIAKKGKARQREMAVCTAKQPEQGRQRSLHSVSPAVQAVLYSTLMLGSQSRLLQGLTRITRPTTPAAAPAATVAPGVVANPPLMHDDSSQSSVQSLGIAPVAAETAGCMQRERGREGGREMEGDGGRWRDGEDRQLRTTRQEGEAL